MYDIIGDIHGYATPLEELLRELGYKYFKGAYRHRKRKVIFTGDFIDRGPEIRRTLQIARSMIDRGAALSVMGNHEYSAITTSSSACGASLNYHSQAFIQKHETTYNEFKNHRFEWKNYVDWFKNLPLFLEISNIRIIHACWDNSLIYSLKRRLSGNKLTRPFLRESSYKGTIASRVLKTILSGKVIDLPKDEYHKTWSGNVMRQIRIKWWQYFYKQTYRDYAVNYEENLTNRPVPPQKVNVKTGYSYKEPPVFIGHYWKSGIPTLLKDNVCCVDYSIARKGKLVAYRWDGEDRLDNEKFVSVEMN